MEPDSASLWSTYILEQHGGFIICDSEPAKALLSRCAFRNGRITESRHRLRRYPLRSRHRNHSIRDDEENLRDLAMRFLERSGYRVITAEDCQQAVEAYQKEKDNISLVILDLIMPKVGGKKCLDTLLKIQPEVRVLIASGHSEAENRDELLLAGAKGFVASPFTWRIC